MNEEELCRSVLKEVRELKAEMKLWRSRALRLQELLREFTTVDDELNFLAWQEKAAAMLAEAKKEWCK